MRWDTPSTLLNNSPYRIAPCDSAPTTIMKAGQSVFINGALGGLGQAAFQIAKSMGASVTGRVGPGNLEAARALGLDQALDYTAHLPPSLHGRFDIVMDTNGSLSIEQGNALINRKGLVIDAVPTTAKVLRSLISPRRKFLMSMPTLPVLRKVIEMAGTGGLLVSIGRKTPLTEAIVVIQDLEAGLKTQGKSIVVMS